MAENSKRKGQHLVFEDVLDRIGPIGPGQILVLLSSAFTDISCCFFFFFFIIEGATPGFKCAGEEWDKCPESVDCQNVTFRNDFTSLSTEFGLVCERTHYLKTTSSISFGGILIGSLMCTISDYVGRKRVLLTCLFFAGILQGVLGFLPSLDAYMGVKFCIGIFAGTANLISGLLPMEYMGIRWRRLVIVGFGWAFGYIIFGGIAYLIRPWRYLTMTYACLPIVTAIVFAVLLPESARWYIQRNRYKEALNQLNWVAKLNRKPHLTDLNILRQIREESISEIEAERRYNITDMFRTKRYAIITVVQMYAMFANSIIHYGLANEISTLIGSIYLNIFVMGSLNMVVRFTTGIVLEKLGRRAGLPFYASIPVTMCFVVMVVELAQASVTEYVRSWLAICAVSVMGGVWNTCFAYVMETYPTLLRSTALAFLATMTRIGGIVAPQISLLGLYHHWIPYAIFGTCGLVEMITMYACMSETAGKPLNEKIEEVARKPPNVLHGTDMEDGEILGKPLDENIAEIIKERRAFNDDMDEEEEL